MYFVSAMTPNAPTLANSKLINGAPTRIMSCYMVWNVPRRISAAEETILYKRLPTQAPSLSCFLLWRTNGDMQTGILDTLPRPSVGEQVKRVEESVSHRQSGLTACCILFFPAPAAAGMAFVAEMLLAIL